MFCNYIMIHTALTSFYAMFIDKNHTKLYNKTIIMFIIVISNYCGFNLVSIVIKVVVPAFY